MKIGITCHASAGGSGVMATELGIALAEKGHTVHFVTYDTPFRLNHYRNNVFVHLVNSTTYPLFHHPPSSLSLAAKIAEVAEEHAIDIWHAHYAIPNAASAILARQMLPPEKRFKLVTTLHGTDITLVGSDPSYFRITRFSIESSDAVTAVSNWLRNETRREFDIQRPIQTVYNFLDLSKFHVEPPTQCRLTHSEEKVIMHISNFRPVKRVTDIVRAFRRILDRVPSRLVMIGEGPERIASVRVAKQLGLTDHITYLGNCDRIEEILPCADLVFQPSEHESFGLVPLEAMACAVPVLATASGGICEVVEHGVTGYLCEVGDIDAMANYAIEILTDPAKAREMGRQARLRVKEHFDQGHIVRQYENLYAQLVGSGAT